MNKTNPASGLNAALNTNKPKDYFRNGYKEPYGSCLFPMMVDINSEYAMTMIRDFIQLQKDILGLPNLTPKQKDDINSLGHELGALRSQADDDKIKTGLIDMMNRL
jgi:hypothetical protein